MRISMEDPITEPLTIKITWNGDEVVRKDFAIGETPEAVYDAPPNVSGVAQVYFIKDGEETPAGSATYWAPDLKGAQMLVDEAKALGEKKSWQARTKLIAAAKILEKLAPDTDDLVNIYNELWGICFFAKARPENRSRRQLEGIAWYEKVIAVYERTGNLKMLGGNLINLGAMYLRHGDEQTALKRALRGLEIERANNDSENPEAIHAWTHCADHLIRLGHTRRAEKVIAEGLARFPNNTSRAYLLNYKAKIFAGRAAKLTAQAEALRKEAEEILPPDSCPL